MRNPSEAVDFWIMDFWIVPLELRKRSCLEIWSSSAKKESLGEDAFMNQYANHGDN